MSDPLSRKVYLQALPDPLLPARHSVGTLRRCAQLQEFLKALQRVAKDRLGTSGGAELLVLKAQDWRELFTYPYGLPFTRTAPKGGSDGPRVSMIAPADYPQRMMQRFDDLFMRAAKAGQRPPGDTREFLDLLLGHEWGHAAANLSALRTHLNWFDEFMATYLFLLALHEAAWDGIRERFVGWARLTTAGLDEAGVQRESLRVPRSRRTFEHKLALQGFVTLHAHTLAVEQGWAFPERLRSMLQAIPKAARQAAVLELEPRLGTWFVADLGEQDVLE
jgi:hypothetical protein